MSEKIKIFTSPHCPPCQELKNKLTPKELAKIEFVDIHTDEGFREAVAKKVMGVPFAEKDGKRCKILFNGDKVKFECEEKNA